MNIARCCGSSSARSPKPATSETASKAALTSGAPVPDCNNESSAPTAASASAPVDQRITALITSSKAIVRSLLRRSPRADQLSSAMNAIAHGHDQRHALPAADRRRGRELDVVVVDVPLGEAVEELVERDLAFEAGQVRAQAVVHSVAEGE